MAWCREPGGTRLAECLVLLRVDRVVAPPSGQLVVAAPAGQHVVASAAGEAVGVVQRGVGTGGQRETGVRGPYLLLTQY